MFGNIIDYVAWRGDLTFEQDSFNEVDSEVLSHLFYNKLESFVESDFKNQITIKELTNRFKNSPDIENLSNMGLMINPRTPELLYECGNSERYGNIKVCGLVSKIDIENQEQFAAITFILGKEVLVVFRGTDDTIVGWREDFNIAYLEKIPGQIDALNYLSECSKYFKNKIIVSGHSKGGNLALFASSNVDKKIQKRILNVYNLDGPGFTKEFFNSEGYLRIKDKVVSIYPSCDIVGMLFNHDEEYTIIKSNGKGVMQHDGVNWQICGKKFVSCENFTEDSRFFEKAFNEWQKNLSKEDIEKFVNAIFSILEAPGYKNLNDLGQNTLKASTKMIECYSKMSAETKKEIKRIFNAFMHVVKQEIPMFNFLK